MKRSQRVVPASEAADAAEAAVPTHQFARGKLVPKPEEQYERECAEARKAAEKPEPPDAKD